MKFEKFLNVCCWTVLIFYFAIIAYVNLIDSVSLYATDIYATDMYSDMMYAVEAWKQKSIFPEGWVFGNQLYVISTPVVASVFYGITGNPVVAMGLASSLMAICTLLAFDWMLKSVLKKRSSRTICCVAFMSLVLFCGGVFSGDCGWQLLFTLCSYYACYAITAFLCFGCYLRSDSISNISFILAFILSCFFSFATGMQSLRQTVIMVCPLMLAEAIHIAYNFVKHKKISKNSLFISLCFSILNILGLICSKVIQVEQVEIFGKIGLVHATNIAYSIKHSITNVINLFNFYNIYIAIGVIFFIAVITVYALIKIVLSNSKKSIVYALLFLTSLICVFSIDVLTEMNIRSIYYFMLLPFVAFIVGWLNENVGRNKKHIICVGLAFFVAANIPYSIYSIKEIPTEKESGYTEVSEYLLSNDITTIYTCWGLGDKIAITSDFSIQSGFWDTPDIPFEGVRYLCNPQIFSADPEQCAYVFKGKNSLNRAIEVTKNHGYDFRVIQHFEKNDIYICVSQDKIMQLMSN